MNEKDQRILDATMRLIYRHGYSKVTMQDVAREVGVSRPTLYASFANKEAILSALIRHHCDLHEAEAERELKRRKTTRAKLELLFDVWILQPVASVIELDNALELIANCALYAPEAVDELYARFEAQVRDVIGDADVAHIMMMATRGLKSSTQSLAQLSRLVDGLIGMALGEKKCKA